MTKRAAIYVRVSTGEQTIDNQLAALRAKADAAGWTVTEVYADEGISGAKGRDQRPAFDRLLKDAARGKVDIVAAWSVDRLGRSLQDLCGFLAELHQLGVNLYLDRQGLDTTTPGGKAMFQMMGVFAEFERAVIQERVRAGLARAKATGTRSGRAIGRPRVAPGIEQRIRDAVEAGGQSVRAMARAAGVSIGTVQRIKAAVEARP